MTVRRTSRPGVYRTGLSLVEVLLAVLVLGLALIPIVSLIQSETRQVRFNEQHALASLLAGQLLERYRYEPRDDLAHMFATQTGAPIDSDALLTPRDEPAATDFLQLLRGFERTLEYRSDGPDTYELRAHVRWRDSRGQPQEVVQSLVLAKNPALGAVQ